VPQNLGNISAGDTITWVNTAGTHDVTSANIPAGATAWASGDLNGSATFSRTFTVVGNYRYFSSSRSTAADANATPQTTGEMVGQFTVVAADTVAPNAPTGLTATAAGGSGINLAWTVSTPADATSQQLFRSTTATKPATPITTIANNTIASYADGGLTAATLYYYWLDAVDGVGNRSTSATANATTAAVTAATFTVQIDDTSRLFVPQNLGSLAVKSIGTDAVDGAPGDDAVFTSGTKTVPVSRMGWRVNPSAATAGTAPYAALSDLNATVRNAAGGTPAAGVDTYLQYQLQTLYSNPVGLRYRTVLLFTATSP